MTIATYDELRGAVASWLARGDLADRVPAFIALAEARINRLIRTREMETRAGAETLAGNPYLPLPADFGGVRWLRLATGPARLLEPASPQQIEATPAGWSRGRPRLYAIVGDQFRLAPAPDAAYPVEISYSRKVPALSAEAPVNWLLAGHPDLYLWGALTAAEGYLGNDARIGLWKVSFDEALAELESQDAMDRWSGGPLGIRADSGTP